MGGEEEGGGGVGSVAGGVGAGVAERKESWWLPGAGACGVLKGRNRRWDHVVRAGEAAWRGGCGVGEGESGGGGGDGEEGAGGKGGGGGGGGEVCVGELAEV